MAFAKVMSVLTVFVKTTSKIFEKVVTMVKIKTVIIQSVDISCILMVTVFNVHQMQQRDLTFGHTIVFVLEA